MSDIHCGSSVCTTHVDGDAVSVEDCGLGVVGGEVPVELVAVPVPLDGVQLVVLIIRSSKLILFHLILIN